MIYKYLCNIVIILTLASCNFSNGFLTNFDDYKQSALFAKLSTNNSNKLIPKIVFISKSKEADQLKTKAENLSIDYLKEYLLKNSNINILRDDKKIDLKEELKLYEIKEQFGNDNGLNLADYLVEIEVNKIKFGKNHIKIVTFIKIYSLPKMNLVMKKEIEYKYSAFESQEILLQEGLNEMINDLVGETLANFFYKLKNGNIIERRVKNDDIIYRINLGKKDGVKTNSNFYLYDKISSDKFGEAYNIGVINENESWIRIKNNNNSKMIEKGDIVKLIPQEIEGSSFKNIARNIGVGVGTVAIVTTQIIVAVVVITFVAYLSVSDNNNNKEISEKSTY
jgi:hypothetical protein